MAWNRRISVILAIALMILVGCQKDDNAGNPTREEFDRLMAETSIGENNIQTIKEDFRKFLLLVYNPPSQTTLDSSVDILRPYCTEGLLASIQGDLGQFATYSNNNIQIEELYFNDGISHSDGLPKLLCEIVAERNDVKARIYVEFTMNSNNVFFNYDTWMYNL